MKFKRPKNCYEDKIEHQRRNFYNGHSRYIEDNLYYRRERSHRCNDDDMFCRKERSCKQNADLNYGEKRSQEYHDDTSDYKKFRGEFRQALQRIEKGWERLFESYIEKLNQQKEENKELHVFSVEPRESIDEKKVEVVSDDDLEIVKEEEVIELKPNSDVVEYKGMEADVADEIPQEVMKVESNIDLQTVEEEVKVEEKVAGSVKLSNVEIQEVSYHRANISVWDCVWNPGWFDSLESLQFQSSCPIRSRNVAYVPKSAHKEYWDWCALCNHSWRIENNLGDRGKFRVMRVQYFKHECERYTRVLRDHKHTCEELSFLYPSNLFLQVFAQRLKDLVFLSINASDSRTNLFEEGGNDGDLLALGFTLKTDISGPPGR